MLTFKDQLDGWMKGQPAACQFIEQMTEALHLWDDLIDRDHPISTESIHQAFWNVLIALPRNPFYLQHFSILNGLLQQAILNWHIANRMETEDDHLHIAFILRSSYADLITACAWIVGGEKWAIQVGYEARLLASVEGYTSYLAQLQTEPKE